MFGQPLSICKRGILKVDYDEHDDHDDKNDDDDRRDSSHLSLFT